MGKWNNLVATPNPHNRWSDLTKEEDDALRPANQVGDISTITTQTIEEPKVIGAGFVDDIKENWPIYGGALAGGIAGGVPGAALGGAAGESYKQIGQHITGDPEAPQTPMEAATRIGKEGAIMGAYEAGGRAVSAVAGKALAPFKKTVTPEGKIAQEVFDKYMPKETSWKKPISKILGLKKTGVLPAEATEHYGLDLMNNIAEGSMLGGKKIADFKNITRKKAIEDMTDDLVNNFGKQVDSDQLGNFVADTIQTKFKHFKENITTPIYNKVQEITAPEVVKKKVWKDVATGRINTRGIPITKRVLQEVEEEVGGVQISTKELKNNVLKQIKRAKQIGGVEGKAAGDDIARAISQLPDNIQFHTAKDLRTRLLATVDEFSVANKKAPAIKVATDLRHKLDFAISKALKKQNPKAHELWRQANNLYKKGSEKYNNRFLRSLIKKADPDFGGEPEKVLSAIFKKGGVSTVNNVKNAVGQKSFDQLKGWHIRELIKKSTKDGLLQGDILQKSLYSSTGLGREAVNAIYTKAERESIERVATALKTAQTKQAAGGGKFLIQIAQGSAIVAAATGQLQEGALPIILGPEVMARMITNPIASKWLSEGLITIPKSAGAITAAGLRATKFIEQYSEPYFTKEKEADIINSFER